MTAGHSESGLVASVSGSLIDEMKKLTGYKVGQDNPEFFAALMSLHTDGRKRLTLAARILLGHHKKVDDYREGTDAEFQTEEGDVSSGAQIGQISPAVVGGPPSTQEIVEASSGGENPIDEMFKGVCKKRNILLG